MNKVLIIGGPTGIGKSELAVRLALRYNAVIVSADSMQIYRRMNIGTGKVTEEEKQGILHTMIDIVEPNEDYSVQKYCMEAKKHIDSALQSGKLPIVVGGTGLYINALINEQNFADAPPDPQLREKYDTIYREKGAEFLHELLRKTDPISAEKIAVNDVKRTVRALEIQEQTGRSKSEIVSEHKCKYDFRFYIPDTDREKLYEKINARVDKMFTLGLTEEVLSLRPFWDCNSMQAIGYKEIIDAYRTGKNPYDAAELIKQSSRRYAKRQRTFFKWIRAEKIYVSEDFYTEVIHTADRWLNGESL